MPLIAEQIPKIRDGKDYVIEEDFSGITHSGHIELGDFHRSLGDLHLVLNTGFYKYYIYMLNTWDVKYVGRRGLGNVGIYQGLNQKP